MTPQHTEPKRTSKPTTWASSALKRAVGAVCASLLVLCVGGGFAHADDVDKMKEQVQQYTLKLADLEKADAEKGALSEIKLTQLWLNEAQAQLVREEEELAAKNLRRVDIAVEMIAALIEAAKSERAALDRESAAIKMKQEMQEAKVALEQAEARKKTLLNQTVQDAKEGGTP